MLLLMENWSFMKETWNGAPNAEKDGRAISRAYTPISVPGEDHVWGVTGRLVTVVYILLETGDSL